MQKRNYGVVESIICTLLEISCEISVKKIVKIGKDLTKLQLITKQFHFFGHPVVVAVKYHRTA